MTRMSIFAAMAAMLALVLGTSPASAQVTENMHQNNGVTCYERVGGTYPENGNFWYCNGQSNPNKMNVLNAIKNVLGAFSNVRTPLATAGVRFYVFANSVDAAKFKTPVQNPPVQDLINFYNGTVGEAGRSYEPLVPETLIYESIATGTYPNFGPPLSIGEIRHSAMHEMGHQYDFYGDPTGYRSDQLAYKRIVRKDQTQMELQAESPSAASLRSTYGYFLNKNANGQWRELYAEEFAYYVISARGSSVGTQLPVAAAALTPYFSCSRLFVQKHITDDRDPTNSELQAIGCDGAMLCFTYTAPTSSYPANGVNAYICGPSDNPADLPSSARYTQLFTDLNTELAKAANNAVTTKLSAQRVMYFHFRTRAEANDFFDNQKPVSANPGYQTTGIGERCGHTFYNSSGVVVAAAIYDECSLGLGPVFTQIQNPSLLRTAIHETGRAFALAYQKGGTTDPSATSGFTTMYNSDAITPSNWSSYTPAEKTTFICGLFGSVGNSPLEVAMGAHATNSGAVCTSGTVNAPWRSGTTFHTPSQIALNDDKVPDSTIGSKSETWAEEFTVLLLGKTSPSNFLPITDWFFGYDNPPTVGGVTPKRSMNCTRFVVETYRNTGNKPTNAQLTTQGCPTHPDYN